MGWSFVYLALCRLLQLVVLLSRSERSKELEILLLRHELAILRRQPRRPPVRPVAYPGGFKVLPNDRHGFHGRAHWKRSCLVVASMVLLGLAFAASAAAADNPMVPPASAILSRNSYELPDSPLDPVSTPNSPPGNNGTLLWGYEANFGNSRILSYSIAPYLPGPDCVPDAAAGGPTGNGRGVAFDPLDGNLWITRLTDFLGDGYIHKVTPPNVTPGTCTQLYQIPFGDGPGGTIQDDIGALDVDQGSKHIWAAGYSPITLDGGLSLRNYFYLVNRYNGKIIQSCYTPANVANGLGFNDSLTYARLKGLPGSGQYLLTDGGEFFPGSPLEVIDTSSCHDGKAATVVANFNTSHGVTGIDFEWPGLLSADVFTASLYNDGDQPFTSSTLIGATGAFFGLEDISLCGFRAKFGGDGNDLCPY